MAKEKPLRRIAPKDVTMVATNREQLVAWVEGKNVHARAGGSWECCPDFSCCYPDCAVSTAVRKKFVASGADGRMKLLGNFLSAFIEKVSKRPGDVVVVGTKGGRRDS